MNILRSSNRRKKQMPLVTSVMTVDGGGNNSFEVIKVMVTSEMIGAGISELKGYEDGSGESAGEIVTRIYLAMLEVALGRSSPDLPRL